MLSVISSYIPIFGTYQPSSDAQRDTLLKYKSNFLYTREYKKCVNGNFHNTYIYDEPLNCLNDNYLQEALSSDGVALGGAVSPDLIHILKTYKRSEDLTVKTLANKEGQVMSIIAYLKLPQGQELKTLKEMSAQIDKAIGLPILTPDLKFNIYEWGWVTPDGYDIKLKNFKNYALISYVNRDAYNVINKNKINIY
ncbi:hypothetical protein [Photobacterium kishitanii]|uniref:Uncharacterized protein n=1 Tax=Photobacterium kishitanii TaxID=318456 RepID=A0A2T3KMV3_9GAMM|nr:hypothetical protein [Photobacterium kishitanii]PSV01130.1 hypothetical protein C9J27_03665 [Photobacterium kishitanii]